jgi:hypothetical protein
VKRFFQQQRKGSSWLLGEAEFAIEEVKLERKRQALQAKRRRAEETPVQFNWVQYPSAHTGASGIARQSTFTLRTTSRLELVKAAYSQDL